MLKDPPVNTGGPGLGREPRVGVSGMQAKLHRWAVADSDRRFDDLFNLCMTGDADGGVRPGRGEHRSRHSRR